MYKDLLHQFYTVMAAQTDAVLLETSRYETENTTSYLFCRPVRVLELREAAGLADFLTELEAATSQGLYAAGYFAYECNNVLTAPVTTQPLAWFGLYTAPVVFDHATGQLTCPPGLDMAELATTPLADSYAVNNLHFDLDEYEYAAKIAAIKAEIEAGNTYQINLTGRYYFDLTGDALALYKVLRQSQPVAYGAFIRTQFQQVLCFSPELFFRRDGQRIVTRPMKGTARRGRTVAEDLEQSRWLQQDNKNRAENLMIVDLLRNDLGRLCEPGSIQVPQLFQVEKYRRLFQMTSTVEGRLRDDITYTQLFNSLFPCGSITGAPKLSSMQIIQKLEASARGVYTGAIGFFAPDNQAVFNVAIRTLVIDEDGRGVMGVGSGIVYDSQAEAEYAECALKAQFLTNSTPQPALLTAVLWNDGYRHLDKHIARLTEAAEYFGYQFEEARLLEVLDKAAQEFAPSQSYKVRVQMQPDSTMTITATPVHSPPPGTILTAVITSTLTNSLDPLLFYKNTSRALYDRATVIAAQHGHADILFFNEQGHLTEGATNNVFIEKDGLLLTPPLTDGLLNGIFRQVVLETCPSACEQVLTRADLLTADRIWLVNSIRGWREVTLAPNLIEIA